MSNGSVAAATVAVVKAGGGGGEDIWVCNRCGWRYPNRHPSARHRRNHRKHCGRVKGFEVVQEEQRDHHHAGGGSSDDVSSGEEESNRNHRQHQQGTEGAAAASAPEKTSEAVAEGNAEENKTSTTVTPISTTALATPNDDDFDPRQDSAAHPELWEQLLDAHVTETLPPAPVYVAANGNGNAGNASMGPNPVVTQASEDGSVVDNIPVNPFIPQSPVTHQGQQREGIRAPESSQLEEIPAAPAAASGKNPFLQMDTNATSSSEVRRVDDDKEKAEASSSASWDSIRPHVALKSLFDEDRGRLEQSGANVYEEEEAPPPPPPKRTNSSSVLKKVIDNVRNSPAKFSGGGGRQKQEQRQRQRQQQQQRSWWSNLVCCTPRIS